MTATFDAPTLPPLDPAGLHPDWCLPAFCETAGPVTRHLSAPIVWRMAGEDVDVCMQRVQEGAGGEVLIELSFANRAYPSEAVTLTFTEEDEGRLFTGFQELRGCQ